MFNCNQNKYSVVWTEISCWTWNYMKTQLTSFFKEMMFLGIFDEK